MIFSVLIIFGCKNNAEVKCQNADNQVGLVVECESYSKVWNTGSESDNPRVEISITSHSINASDYYQNVANKSLYRSYSEFLDINGAILDNYWFKVNIHDDSLKASDTSQINVAIVDTTGDKHKLWLSKSELSENEYQIRDHHEEYILAADSIKIIIGKTGMSFPQDFVGVTKRTMMKTRTETLLIES
jgi:hypothetical protein